jgi:hypothetical protein
MTDEIELYDTRIVEDPNAPEDETLIAASEEPEPTEPDDADVEDED